jgi:hypothetical protein
MTDLVPITEDILRTRMLWDIMPIADVPKAMKSSHVMPPSEDVGELENAASVGRLSRVVPLMPIMNSLATIGGGILSSAMLEQLEVDDDMKAVMRILIYRTSVASVQASVANLMALGLLKEGWL